MNDNELKQYFTFLDALQKDGKEMREAGMKLMNEYGLMFADAKDVVQQWWSSKGPGQENAIRALKPMDPLPMPQREQNEPLPQPEGKVVSMDEKLARRLGSTS